MKKILAFPLFYIFYFFLYCWPFYILMLLDEQQIINYDKFLESMGDFTTIFVVFIYIYTLILPAFRAKLAVDAYGTGNTKLWDAHGASKGMFNVYLAFLPVIGRYFYNPEHDKETGGYC